MNELKPCPFCGGNPFRGEDYIACSTIGCTIYCDPVSEIDWNTRHDDSMQEKMDKMRSVIKSIRDDYDYGDKLPFHLDFLVSKFNEIFGEEVK